MKVFQRLALSVAVLGTVTFVNPVYAINESDCSIWLCLPMGFPSGCEDAKSAFKKRIKKFKPPLPYLGSCLINEDEQPVESSEMSAKEGFAALISEKRICSQWNEQHSYCDEYETVPTHVIKNTRCFIGENGGYPDGCSKTIRYVDTYMDGNVLGETYYFDNEGNKVSIP